jgi:hypothetical protein
VLKKGGRQQDRVMWLREVILFYSCSFLSSITRAADPLSAQDV